jgi:hypothetical protein
MPVVDREMPLALGSLVDHVQPCLPAGQRGHITAEKS